MQIMQLKRALSKVEYAFDDLGEHHAQSLRKALKQDPVTKGRFSVRRMDQQGYPGHRGAFIKK